MSDPTYFHGPGLGRLGIPSVGERPFVASSFLLFRYRTLKQKVNRLDARAISLLKPRLINNGKVSFLHFFLWRMISPVKTGKKPTSTCPVHQIR
jgi:hypothetical protein